MALFVYGFIALIFIIFAISNSDPVALQFSPLPFTLEAPLYLFFFIVLILGVVIGYMVGLSARIKSRSKMHKLEKNVRTLEKEVHALREV